MVRFVTVKHGMSEDLAGMPRTDCLGTGTLVLVVHSSL